MASESVVQTTNPNLSDAIDEASARVDECISMMEMAWRTKETNEQDCTMLRNVCFVTFERLVMAKTALEAAS